MMPESGVKLSRYGLEEEVEKGTRAPRALAKLERY
jgi:hypothetical protein